MFAAILLLPHFKKLYHLFLGFSDVLFCGCGNEPYDAKLPWIKSVLLLVLRFKLETMGSGVSNGSLEAYSLLIGVDHWLVNFGN